MRFTNNRISVSIVASMALLLANCAAPKPTTTTSQGGKYSEDLSVLRPKVETETQTVATTSTDEKKQTPYVEPKYTVNKQLDAVLDSIDRINVARNAVDGFTIQVYSGRREEALNAKKTLTNVLPDLDSEVQFTEPIFRVKVGKYFTRLQAQQDYSEVKRYFPAAIIIPEKIPTR